MLSEAVSTASVCFFTVNGWAFCKNNAINCITDNAYKILHVWERTSFTSAVSYRRKYCTDVTDFAVRGSKVPDRRRWELLISGLWSWVSDAENSIRNLDVWLNYEIGCFWIVSLLGERILMTNGNANDIHDSERILCWERPIHFKLCC